MSLTAEYRATLRKKHAQAPDWGTSAPRYLLGDVRDLVKTYSGATTAIDYGCGKVNFAAEVRGLVRYDPAIDGIDVLPPGPFDLVLCLDVLEHIEPEHLAATLTELRSLMGMAGLFVICHRLANHTLPDGRNAHLIVEPMVWWHRRLADAGFCVVAVPQARLNDFTVLVVEPDAGSDPH